MVDNEAKSFDLLKKYPKIKSYLGDIRDKDSITNSFSKFKPQVVINTAALKHVPICEDNAIESVTKSRSIDASEYIFSPEGRDLISDAFIAYLEDSSLEKGKREIISQLLDDLFDVSHARRMGLDIR